MIPSVGPSCCASTCSVVSWSSREASVRPRVMLKFFSMITIHAATQDLPRTRSVVLDRCFVVYRGVVLERTDVLDRSIVLYRTAVFSRTDGLAAFLWARRRRILLDDLASKNDILLLPLRSGVRGNWIPSVLVRHVRPLIVSIVNTIHIQSAMLSAGKEVVHHEETDCGISAALNLPIFRHRDVRVIAIRFTVHAAHVAAQKPRVLPFVFALDVAISTVALAFLYDKSSAAGPGVIVLFVVARHVCQCVYRHLTRGDGTGEVR